MKLVNMQQSAEEANEKAIVEQGDATDAPRYPYGLELRLDEESLAKLGFQAPPQVGTTFVIQAKVVVSSASAYQTQGGEAEYGSCWQITDLGVEQPSKSRDQVAATLYDAK